MTSKPEVRALLTNFGKGKLNQRAAQAAAWNLANEMPWEQLAVSAGIVLAVALIATAYFRKVEDDFAAII